MKTPPKYFTAKDTSWCGSDNTCECTLSVKRMEKPQSLRGYYSVYRHRDSHNVLRKGTDYFNKKVSCEKMIIVGFLRCKIICSKPEDVHGGTPTTYKLHHQPSWCHHVLQTVCNLSWEPTPENNHEKLVMSRYQFTHKLTACVDHNHALGSGLPFEKVLGISPGKPCGLERRPSKAKISGNRGVHHRISNPSLLVIGESTSWWLNQPIWKIWSRQIGSISPGFGMKHPKIFEFPPPIDLTIPFGESQGAVDDQQQQDHCLGKRRGVFRAFFRKKHVF